MTPKARPTKMNHPMFSNLIKSYPTSEALFAWLRSEEGGQLIVRENTTNPEKPLAVIYYDKKQSDMTKPHVQQFRSVVWDALANRPVSVGPSRGFSFQQAVDDKIKLFTVEDFVDGVMINMFHDGVCWRLATRTQLDAAGHFYGTRSFAELFWETFRNSGLDFADLNPRHTYSWVLQHPAERVVVAPQYGIPRLYMVEYSGSGDVSEKVALLRPKIHDLKSLEDIKERVMAWGKRFGAAWQGLVIKASNGKRYKIRSVQYNDARELRGNQAKLPYLWLERWSEGRLGAYLKQYPEEEHGAPATVAAFKACTQELHDLYQQVYRQKSLPLGQAPHKYRKLLWEVHQAGKGAYFKDLRDFMNKQDTARKLFLINYETRYPAA